MTDTIYYDQNGKPCLRESFCIYCDFLGMKDKMMSDQSEEIFYDFIKKIEPLINDFTSQRSKGIIDSPRVWDIKMFTDNIVLTYTFWSQQYNNPKNPWSNMHFRPELGHVIMDVPNLQLHTALEGYFVRGGWAIGRLFINENIVYGKPIIKSVRLEKQAKYPRVILSKGVKNLVKKQIYQLGDSLHSNDIWVDESDGQWFINYLADICAWSNEPRWDQLDLHAEMVKKQLEQNKGNCKVLEKYLWLANYHNCYCQHLCDFDEWDAALIKIDLPQYGFHPLSKDDCAHLSQS